MDLGQTNDTQQHESISKELWYVKEARRKRLYTVGFQMTLKPAQRLKGTRVSSRDRLQSVTRDFLGLKKIF